MKLSLAARPIPETAVKSDLAQRPNIPEATNDIRLAQAIPICFLPKCQSYFI